MCVRGGGVCVCVSDLSSMRLNSLQLQQGVLVWRTTSWSSWSMFSYAAETECDRYVEPWYAPCL